MSNLVRLLLFPFALPLLLICNMFCSHPMGLLDLVRCYFGVEHLRWWLNK